MENAGDETSNETGRSAFSVTFKFHLTAAVTGCLRVKKYRSGTKEPLSSTKTDRN